MSNLVLGLHINGKHMVKNSRSSSSIRLLTELHMLEESDRCDPLFGR